jgi:hypothetical protein
MSFLDSLIEKGIDPTGLASGLLNAGIGIVSRQKAKKQYDESEKAFKNAYGSRPMYQIPKEIQQQLAMQQAQYNAEDQSIKQARAAQDQALSNYMGSAQRNASSGQQALATAGEVAGMGMQGNARLAAQQFQNQLQKGATLTDAQNAMAQQRGIQFNDALNRNYELQNYELGKMQAQRQNMNDANQMIYSAAHDLVPAAIGGLGALLGKKGSTSGLPGLQYKNVFGGGRTGFQEAMGQPGGTGFGQLGKQQYQFKLPNFGKNPFLKGVSFKPTGSVPYNPSYVMNTGMFKADDEPQDVNQLNLQGRAQMLQNPWNMQKFY